MVVFLLLNNYMPLERMKFLCQCFAIDINTKTKEPIGYCILDIRSARLNDPSQV